MNIEKAHTCPKEERLSRKRFRLNETGQRSHLTTPLRRMDGTDGTADGTAHTHPHGRAARGRGVHKTVARRR